MKLKCICVLLVVLLSKKVYVDIRKKSWCRHENQDVDFVDISEMFLALSPNKTRRNKWPILIIKQKNKFPNIDKDPT